MRRVQRNKPVSVVAIDLLDVKTLQNAPHAMAYHIILGTCDTNFEHIFAKLVQTFLHDFILVRVILEGASVRWTIVPQIYLVNKIILGCLQQIFSKREETFSATIQSMQQEKTVTADTDLPGYGRLSPNPLISNEEPHRMYTTHRRDLGIPKVLSSVG